MENDVFADGIGEISVVGGVVRMDLVALSATERDAANQPKMTFRQRIIMPVEAFLRAFEAQGDVMRRLADAGVVTISDEEKQPTSEMQTSTAAKPVAAQVAPAPTLSVSPRSPNFAT
ncbi:MAG: hypothetical protein HQL34_03895 [Alphaproteobacteria bacterium]|nr:hypothetical protein [Alphaproteobacteria bacterium]